MKFSSWDEIHDFYIWSEFDRFVEWIDGQVKNDIALEVPVGKKYFGGIKERWFKHVESGETWRLVWPDPPFTGVFERVKLPEPPANSKKPAP